MDPSTCTGVICEEPTQIYLDHPTDMLDPSTLNPSFVSIILVHSVTFVVGVIGNSVVVVTWTGLRPSRIPTCIFLVSLAVADLVQLLVCVPLETLEYFLIIWDARGATCKIRSYIEMLSGMASILNLTAVSCERFLVIVFPIQARRFCTLSNCRKGLVAVWTVATFLACPVLATKRIYPITYYNNNTNLTLYYCWDNNHFLAFYVAVYQLVTMFVLPALFMSVCYFWVIRELWSSTRNVAVMTQVSSKAQVVANYSRHSNDVRFSSSVQRKPHCHHHYGKEVSKGRKQIIKMLLIVVILFLVCWGPRLVMNVAIKQGLDNFTHSAYAARIVFYLLPFIQSSLNPFVYGFMSSNFRHLMLHSCFAKFVQLICRKEKSRIPSKRKIYRFNNRANSEHSCKITSVDLDAKSSYK
ncbi:allatostatin-A receptor-like [Centruroides sculpturatus]|uniref:allatostatin-A receptor-like n=1 Tax=Centruroides sculpturatus TaxID=218467 RepID=UPI000C6EB284|nr:allatostatin-A receptor-like [Centruroides sculpturatus]